MNPIENQLAEKEKKQLNLSLVLSGLFLFLVLAGTVWFFLRFTDSQSGRSVANKTAKDESSAKRLNHGGRKKAAFKFQRMMQQKEQRLQAKYARSQKPGTKFDKQGRQNSYRKWRAQKEQNERFLSRFKNDNTTDPNSVKMQLLKGTERFNKDRPAR